MIYRDRFSFCATTLALFIASTVTHAQVSPESTDDTTYIRRHVVSPRVVAAMAADLPKYSPPKPVKKKPESDEMDLRDINLSRNQIIRLPAYIVREAKPPVFREGDIYTSKGLGKLAKNRFISEFSQALNRYTIPLIGISSEDYALKLYRQDERLEYISDLNESADDINLVNPKNAKEIRQAISHTYRRGFDYSYRNKN